MTTKDNCQQCRHHWGNFDPEDRDPGHCYMFREYQPSCVLWKGETPLFQDARDPMFWLTWLVQGNNKKGCKAMVEKDGET